MNRLAFPAAFAIAALVSAPTCPAQTTAAAPQTFWNWMGIPSQPLAGIRNRSGNFPGLEKKPPLKAIADPANLESENPAIKKAAEIKAAEDLAPQKIKALKYLAEIGCGGCYEGVDQAIAEALDDCTEAVRYEAVKAVIAASTCDTDRCTNRNIRKAKTCKESMCDRWVGCLKKTCDTMHILCGKPAPDGSTLKSKISSMCGNASGSCPTGRCACGSGNCCTSEILNKLSSLAFERDDRGCWKEPSPRVREMSRQALQVCRKNVRPMTPADMPIPEEVPLREPEAREPEAREPEAREPEAREPEEQSVEPAATDSPITEEIAVPEPIAESTPAVEEQTTPQATPSPGEDPEVIELVPQENTNEGPDDKGANKEDFPGEGELQTVGSTKTSDDYVFSSENIILSEEVGRHDVEEQVQSIPQLETPDQASLSECEAGGDSAITLEVVVSTDSFAARDSHITPEPSVAIPIAPEPTVAIPRKQFKPVATHQQRGVFQASAVFPFLK